MSGAGVDPVTVDGARTVATAAATPGVGVALTAAGFSDSVHVRTCAVENPDVDVHTPGVTVAPDERETARPSSAPATIVPPVPVAAVWESARSV